MQNIKNIYHLLVALLFQIIYGFPARKLKVIGITGTDGKTTTASLIYYVLKTAGRKVSIITSVAAEIGGKQLDTGFHVTTPDPHEVPKYMAQSAINGDEFFVLEITSHAIDQNRAAGVQFEIAGITNITHEHLHYHKTLEDYIQTKARIAAYSKKTLINADQPDIVSKIKTAQPKAVFKTFGVHEDADYHNDIAIQAGIYLEEYNEYNFLLAYAICKELGITDDAFNEASKSFRFPPGRMELIYDGNFTVVSDFAHTPNALDKALPAVLAKYHHRSRLIHVFGAAAFRDDSKRSAMGSTSATYANIIILTEEDYRTEDPEQIFSMLERGIEERGFSEVHSDTLNPPNRTYMKILKREDAIAKAISLAGSQDIIMITGKGCEKSLCRGTKEDPYDERKVIEKCVSRCDK